MNTPAACRLYHFPPELDDEFLEDFGHRSVGVIRVAAWLCLILRLTFVIRSAYIYTSVHIASFAMFFGFQVPLLLVWIAATHWPGAHRWLHRVTFVTLLAVFGLTNVYVMSWGSPAVTAHFPAGLMLVTMIIYAAVRLPFLWATALGWTCEVLFLIAAQRYATFTPNEFALAAFYSAGTNIAGMYVAYVFEGALRRDFLARREIAAEKAKSEKLLLNVLPAAVAERLKAGEEPIADDIADASILFADIVGYTGLSGRMTAPELVGLLNAVFSRFDALADKHGAEKIKTIGDAYMAVCGLGGGGNHADAAAALGREMISELDAVNQERGTQLSVRVGINSGPVVAGVIGLRKFSYDLWGDAVNIASRMESHGVVGRVHLSSETAKRLSDRSTLEDRGVIEIKGKGPMTTYLLGLNLSKD